MTIRIRVRCRLFLSISTVVCPSAFCVLWVQKRPNDNVLPDISNDLKLLPYIKASKFK